MNYEDHDNHIILTNKNGSHENYRIPFDNLENHEMLEFHMRIKKIKKILEFH